MFLDWIAQASLIPPDEESFFLKEFNLSVKQAVAREVVQNMRLNFENLSVMLPTFKHVQWVLEIVGLAFALPMTDAATIEASIDIYTRWCDAPPPVVPEDMLFWFYEQIYLHYSLLFQNRGQDGREVTQHVRLLQRVVNAMRSMALAGQVDETRHEKFTRMLLGCVDCVLSLPPGEDGLAIPLCRLLLQALFDVWFFFRQHNPVMYEFLRAATQRWRRWHEYTVQWATMVHVLTRISLGYVYNQLDNDTVEFAFDVPGGSDPFNILLHKDKAHYAWYHVLMIIGDPNTLERPDLFLTVMQGLSATVELYLDTTLSPKAELPTGRTILRIFGSWLVTAAMYNRPGFEEGTALAVQTLCRIFELKQESPYTAQELAKFYCCLNVALLSGGRVMASALLHSRFLHHLDVCGSRVLIPSAVFACHQVLSMSPKAMLYDDAPMADIREACLASVYAFVAHTKVLGPVSFGGEHPFPPKMLRPTGFPSHIRTMYDVKLHLSYLVLIALETHSVGHARAMSEGDSAGLINLRVLLSTAQAFVVEFIRDEPEPTVQFLQSLMGKLIAKCKDWPDHLVLPCLKFFSEMSQWYHMVHQEVVDTLMQALAVVAMSRKSNEDLVACAMYTMADWVPAGTLAIYRDSLKMVLNVLSQNLTSLLRKLPPNLGGGGGGGDVRKPIGSPGRDESSSATSSPRTPGGGGGNRRTGRFGAVKARKTTSGDVLGGDEDSVGHTIVGTSLPGARLTAKIEDAAYHLYGALTNNVNDFPNPQGPTAVSTVISEDLLFQQISAMVGDEAAHQCFRYYAVSGDALITAIDRPTPNPAQAYVTIIVRDRTGRYSYDVWPMYTAYETPFVPSVVTYDLPVLEEPYRNPTAYAPVGEYMRDQLGHYYPDPDGYTDGCNAMAGAEVEAVARAAYHLGGTAQLLPPEPPNVHALHNKFTLSRTFLSTTGLTSAPQLLTRRAQLLRPGPSLKADLATLDGCAERMQLAVPVVYHRPGEVSGVCVETRAQQTSRAFVSFVNALGWGVQVDSHVGYHAGFDSGAPILPYHADVSHEILFLPGPMVSPEVAKSLSSAHNVFIVWTEELLCNVSPHEILPTPTGAAAYILVHPLDTPGHFHVQVMDEAGTQLFIEPLLRESIISKDGIGPLIRRTLYALHEHLSALLCARTPALNVRQQVLRQVVDAHGDQQCSPGALGTRTFDTLKDEDGSLKQDVSAPDLSTRVNIRTLRRHKQELPLHMLSADGSSPNSIATGSAAAGTGGGGGGGTASVGRVVGGVGGGIGGGIGGGGPSGVGSAGRLPVLRSPAAGGGGGEAQLRSVQSAPPQSPAFSLPPSGPSLGATPGTGGGAAAAAGGGMSHPAFAAAPPPPEEDAANPSSSPPMPHEASDGASAAPPSLPAFGGASHPAFGAAPPPPEEAEEEEQQQQAATSSSGTAAFGVTSMPPLHVPNAQSRGQRGSSAIRGNARGGRGGLRGSRGGGAGARGVGGPQRGGRGVGVGGGSGRGRGGGSGRGARGLGGGPARGLGGGPARGGARGMRGGGGGGMRGAHAQRGGNHYNAGGGGGGVHGGRGAAAPGRMRGVGGPGNARGGARGGGLRGSGGGLHSSASSPLHARPVRPALGASAGGLPALRMPPSGASMPPGDSRNRSAYGSEAPPPFAARAARGGAAAAGRGGGNDAVAARREKRKSRMFGGRFGLKKKDK